MKKVETIKSVIIGILLAGVIFLFTNPRIEEVEKIKEIEVLQTVIDSIYVDKIIEKKVFIPKYITETKTDTITIEVIKEIEKPIEVIKTVYVDKPYEVKVPDYILPESKWYLGFGYKFDKDNYFSGTDIKLLHKFKSDKMFSLDVGLRNDLLDAETGVSKLYPYVGASIYFRLDNTKNKF